METQALVHPFSRIGQLSGISRPTAALRRQMRVLGGAGDIAQVLADTKLTTIIGDDLAYVDRRVLLEAASRAYAARDKGPIRYRIAEHALAFARERLEASAGDTTESNTLKIIFNNTTWGGLGDATGLVGSTVAGSLYVQTETANPGETGTQTTSESAYTSYARVAVARSTGGWTVSGTSPTQAANVAAVTFPACTGGTETETYFAIGRASSSTGELMFYGSLTASLAVSSGITPSFAIGACVATLD